MKKLVMFLLGVVMLGAFVYSGVAFAEVANDESVADQEITLDDVDFPVDGDLGHVIQPRGRGECLSDERLGRVPPGYCSSGRITVKTNAAQRKCLVNMFGYGALSSLSGNVLILSGTLAMTWWNNCRFK
ncbi:hypothetical protein [Enterococcus faecalis]|uniref:hypothetical protein n=1 Tax=Enterococcus faecalis TaxID=1351 RepID=UPI001D183A4B|nr:hypothetical protein [Enterococcus faecalis]MCC4085798.1 hypothetical protein [Enterococcus faecalis]